MHHLEQIGLPQVQEVYRGNEGKIWELVMGQQIHVGGLESSQMLADAADIQPGSCGIDFCCCTGAGMRFLIRFRGVASMVGVDATSAVLELGRQRCRDTGCPERTRFIEADVCNTALPGEQADFVWGEDAWCYVADKPALIAEAARLLRPGGTIAFTDWVEGPAGLSPDQARRTMRFMKFPSFASIEDYRELMQRHGLEVVEAADTGRFARYLPLYLDMLEMQLTFDVLRLIDFHHDRLAAMAGEMRHMKQLADEGRLIQGQFVARKPR
ncbi:MAG: class I SAM-dependent methyltransferase [Phycisphaeraceae bacterium]